MEKQKLVSNKDHLHLADEAKLKQMLDPKQKTLYSIEIVKYNEVNKCQNRIFLITNIAIYTIIKRGNLIKSLMSKIVKFDNSFTIRRKILLENIFGITISKQKSVEQFVIHIKDDFDYRFRSPKKISILKAICGAYINATNKKLAFFFKDDITLVKHCTTKIHLKQKICLKPKQQPNYFNYEELNNYTLPNIKFQLVYSIDGRQIPIEKFLIFKDQELNYKKYKYYTLQTINTQFQNLLHYFQHKNNKFISLPHFCYATKSKTHMFRPLMIGNKIDRLISQKGAFNEDLCRFYVCQMILGLQFFHEKGFIYRCLMLQNIYIKDNGYICLEGLNQSIIKKGNKQYLYSIYGKPSHLSPEMILCDGYNQKTDIWSLGVCIVHMLTGKNIFMSQNLRSTLNSILLLDQLNQYSLPEFLKNMFIKQPEKRISLAQLKQNQWFSSVNWNDIKEQKYKPVYIPELLASQDWIGTSPTIMYLQQ